MNALYIILHKRKDFFNKSLSESKTPEGLFVLIQEILGTKLISFHIFMN